MIEKSENTAKRLEDLEKIVFPFLTKNGFSYYSLGAFYSFEGSKDLRIEEVNDYEGKRDSQVIIGPENFAVGYIWSPSSHTNLELMSGRFGTNYFIKRRDEKLLIEEQKIDEIVLNIYNPEIEKKVLELRKSI